MTLDDLLHRADIPADALDIIRGHVEEEARVSGPAMPTNREQEQLAALDCISDSVVYYRDASLKVAWANRAARDGTGPGRGEPEGDYCYRLWQDRDGPCPECPVLAAFNNGQVHELEWTAVDGRTYRLRAHPVRDEQGAVLGVVKLGTDITERKRAHEAVAQSQDLYRQAIESAAAVPYRRDHRTGDYDFVGAGIGELLDISPEEFSVIAFRAMIRERVNTHPEAPVEWLDYDRAYARGQVSHFRADYRVVTPAGREKWLSDAATAIRDGQTGDLIASLGFLQDVTERKLAEQRILRLTRLYAVLSEANQAMVRLREHDALVATICRIAVEEGEFGAAWIAEKVPQAEGLALRASYGLRQEQVAALAETLSTAKTALGPCRLAMDAGRPCVLRGGDLASIRPWGALWEAGKCDAVAAFPLKVGERMAGALGVSTSDSELLDEEGMRLLTELADDISFALLSMEHQKARERSEAALRESEERYRTIIDASPLSILLTRDERYVYANPAAVRLLGYRGRREIEGRPLEALLGPEQAELVAQRHRLAISGQANAPTELTALRADGTTVSVESVSVPLRLQDGPAALVMAMDISERKQVEEAARLAAVGQLAAGVAHEFNNILATLMLRAEYAGVSGTIDDYRQLAETVGRQAQRGAQICKKLAIFSRPQIPRRQPLCIEDAIEAAHGLLARQLELADIETRFSFHARPARVMADAGQLEQVFVNLLINASHAMPGGGVLAVTTETHGEEGPRPEVIVRVTDSGTGMPPEVAVRVFEPFFTTKGELGGSDVPGNGLGLAVSHGIVTAHGGTITVASQVGQGSTFEIRFPGHIGRHAAPKAPESREVGPSGQDHVGARVLVVEDEADLREVMGLVLSGGGYSVQLAADAGEAIALLHSDHFDVVVTDLLMPGGGGRRVLDHTRQLPTPPPVIVLTGKVEPGAGESTSR